MDSCIALTFQGGLCDPLYPFQLFSMSLFPSLPFFRLFFSTLMWRTAGVIMAADTSHAHSIITQKTDMDKILVLDPAKLVNCVEVRLLAFVVASFWSSHGRS